MSNLSKEEIEHIKSIFNQFDKNKNGTIGRSELTTLSIALNNPLSPSELSDLFRQFDENHNGIISWDEFIRYWSTLN